jgi:hypothetical protein
MPVAPQGILAITDAGPAFVASQPKEHLTLAELGSLEGFVLADEERYSMTSGNPSSGPTARSRSPSAQSMTTSMSSKRSNSRREADRGPKRAAKRAERARQNNIKKEQEERNNPNYLHKQAERAMSSSGPWACKGSMATAMYNMTINEKKKEYEEQQAKGDPEDFEKRVRDSLIKEIPVDQQKYVKVLNGEPYCVLCKKVATEGHIASQAHILKMEEEAISNFLGGCASSMRRFQADLCVGVATKKLIYEFWGDAIQQLPEATKRIHKEKGKFYINSKIDRPLYPEDCMYELGIVSYSGGGKYHASTYIPWHDLPDQEETADEKQLKRTEPPGQGWWPVIALERTYTKQDGLKILLVCFYQLQSDGPVAVWWIWPGNDEAPWEQTQEPISEHPEDLRDYDYEDKEEEDDMPGGVWAEPPDPWADL